MTLGDKSHAQVVPYSDHSSFKELVEFVGVVKPRCIRPIVRSFSGNKSEILSSRCDMSVFDHLLDPTPLVWQWDSVWNGNVT